MGLQVRRTDKLDVEAKPHPIEEYMKHADEFFDVLDLSINTKHHRKIFIASEDPAVITEAQSKYPNYEILYNLEASKISFKLETRYTLSALYGTVADIEMLVACDFVVCTFSSNICRLVLEKKQTQVPDAFFMVKSVDYAYHNFAENSQIVEVAIFDSTAKARNFTVGSQLIINVMHNKEGNYWAASVDPKKRNWGLYPAYTLNFKPEILEFPIDFDLI